jgi:hypothetical protein
MAPPRIWLSYAAWAKHRRKDRAARNRDRREAIREGRAHVGDGTHVDHKDFNPRNHARSNKRVVSESTNSARNQRRKKK